MTTDRGRGNNLANRVGPGAGWSIGACDCDNIRMRTRTGGWRDWSEAGRLSHLKSCVRCSCACSPIEDDRTANGISKWRSITKLVTQTNNHKITKLVTHINAPSKYKFLLLLLFSIPLSRELVFVLARASRLPPSRLTDTRRFRRLHHYHHQSTNHQIRKKPPSFSLNTTRQRSA